MRTAPALARHAPATNADKHINGFGVSDRRKRAGNRVLVLLVDEVLGHRLFVNGDFSASRRELAREPRCSCDDLCQVRLR